MERVAKQKSSQVAFIEVGTALLNLRLLTVNANWAVEV